MFCEGECEKWRRNCPRPTERGIIMSSHVIPQDQAIDWRSITSVCSGARGALCSLRVLEKRSSQRQREQTVDMKPIQALAIVVTLICP